MRRRHLLALAPAAALASCTTSQGGGSGSEGTTGTSDGGSGGGASDGTASPTPDPTAAELLAEELELRELAGQLVLVGITAGSSIDTELLEEHHVGGFFLLDRWESAEEVDALVATAVEGSREDLGPLLAVDQEGGQVRMLRGDAARKSDSAEALGEAGPEAALDAYTMIGEDLAARGLHLDLAPVADVVDPALGDDNAPVGQLGRGFGTNPEIVAGCVQAAVQGLDASGVGATLKHFPGLGRVEENTDHSVEGIVDAVTDADDPYLQTFMAGIAAGAEAVMLSSAVYPRIEPDVPAMFSSAVVQGVLREVVGFDGLVITDDIGAAEAVADVPVPERATRVLAAGGDAVLTADPGIAGELVDAIVAWAEEDAAQEARVRESATRMLTVKQGHDLLDT